MKCESKENPVTKVELKINGKKVELNSFVNNFISATVTGMVKSLRGVDKVETLNLKISKEA